MNPGYIEPICTLANGSLYPGIRWKRRNFTWIRQGGAHWEGSLYPGVRCIGGSLYPGFTVPTYNCIIMLQSKIAPDAANWNGECESVCRQLARMPFRASGSSKRRPAVAIRMICVLECIPWGTAFRANSSNGCSDFPAPVGVPAWCESPGSTLNVGFGNDICGSTPGRALS